tara:strand:- start:169 stop:432 length:264 start_codon:yes stop_codon:yes gene_type:complete
MRVTIKEYAKAVIESLGGVPNLDNPDLFSIKNDLVIRHIKSRIEYTVSKVDLTSSKDPKIEAFRFDPDGNEKFIIISKDEFKEYENI